MPNTSRFKSISVPIKTYLELKNLSENKFEVNVSIQTIIKYLIIKNNLKISHDIKKTNYSKAVII